VMMEFAVEGSSSAFELWEDEDEGHSGLRE
jgi:hypothetical protein